MAYSEDFEDFLLNMIPLFSYHERWGDLSTTDFTKHEKTPETFLRGYHYAGSQVVSTTGKVSDLHMPLLIADEEVEDATLDEKALQYFEKMVSFCGAHDIQLVLMKVPTEWTSAEHNAAQTLAETYGLDFIDFNVEPYYSEIGYNLAVDSVDATASTSNIHANYNGAMKITDYLGQYLTENCNNRDIRGEPGYAFMEDELKEYYEYITIRRSYQKATDPCDFMDLALTGDNTTFISVKGDAADKLTVEQRAYFRSIGLTGLAQLSHGASYLAVIAHREVITEQEEEESAGTSLRYVGTLQNGTSYIVKSGGYDTGNVSSVVIDGIERSNNGQGLNIVVYDNTSQQYVWTASFDTHSSPERGAAFDGSHWETLVEEGTPFSGLTGTDRLLYQYNKKCEDKLLRAKARQNIEEEDGILSYLGTLWNEEDLDIYITVRGDASELLTDRVRAGLTELGLPALAQLDVHDSYVAVISGGEVVVEQRENAKTPLEVSSDNYMLVSAGKKTAEYSSYAVINGAKFRASQRGLYIVVYDNVTRSAADTRLFHVETEETEEIQEAAE